MDFKAFDYSNPPAEGLYWLAYEAADYDCDVDDSGCPVGWLTGEFHPRVAMARVEHYHPEMCDTPFGLSELDDALGKPDLDCDRLIAYAPVIVPKHPKAPDFQTAEASWQPAEGFADESHEFCWMAYSRPDGTHGVGIGFAVIDGDQVWFEALARQCCELGMFEVDDTVTHVIPFSMAGFPDSFRRAAA